MAWTKILLTGDAVTELTGTAYRSLITDSAGDVVEIAHGVANKVWTAQGVSANPSWEDAAAGAHALDAGQTDVVITTPADDEVLAYDGIGDWINQTAAEAGLSEVGHLLGSADHGADTLANLNAKVSDATLDDSSDTRDPNAHTLGGSGHSTDTLANLNTKVSDATLDDSSDTRTPTDDSVTAAKIDATATDMEFAQIILTPTATGTGTTEGSLFYDSDDNHMYVYVV